jgi:hypothetical protein
VPAIAINARPLDQTDAPLADPRRGKGVGRGVRVP